MSGPEDVTETEWLERFKQLSDPDLPFAFLERCNGRDDRCTGRPGNPDPRCRYHAMTSLCGSMNEHQQCQNRGHAVRLSPGYFRCGCHCHDEFFGPPVTEEQIEQAIHALREWCAS